MGDEYQIGKDVGEIRLAIAQLQVQIRDLQRRVTDLETTLKLKQKE